MDWEIYFKNPLSQYDQFVDEERTVIQTDTEKEARAIMCRLLGRFASITEIRNLTACEPVADGAGAVETKEETNGQDENIVE